MKTIAIDPGKNGGCAYCDSNSIVCAVALPQTEGDIHDLLLSLKAQGKDRAVLEHVVGFIPGGGGGALFTFGEGFGFLKGCLTALGYRIELVRPAKWQKALSLGVKKEYGKQWKNHCKEVAQRLFPHATVTLSTADALLLYEYATKTPSTSLL